MTRTRKALIGALVLGLLSGPAIAIASAGFGDGSAEPAAIEATNTSAVTTTVTLGAEAVDTSADDIAAACGSDGMLLVARETAGTLDAVGRAALDALRPICDADGHPLPAPVGSLSPPVTIVETVTVSAAAPSAAATVAATWAEHGDDDEGYDDGHEGYDDGTRATTTGTRATTTSTKSTGRTTSGRSGMGRTRGRRNACRNRFGCLDRVRDQPGRDTASGSRGHRDRRD